MQCSHSAVYRLPSSWFVVSECVEEGGLLVDLLCSTRALLSWEQWAVVCSLVWGGNYEGGEDKTSQDGGGGNNQVRVGKTGKDEVLIQAGGRSGFSLWRKGKGKPVESLPPPEVFWKENGHRLSLSCTHNGNVKKLPSSGQVRWKAEYVCSKSSFGDWQKSRVLPVRSYFNVQGHLHIEKVLVLSQVACHLLLGVTDILLQLTYPHLWVQETQPVIRKYHSKGRRIQEDENLYICLTDTLSEVRFKVCGRPRPFLLCVAATCSPADFHLCFELFFVPLSTTVWAEHCPAERCCCTESIYIM